MPVRFKINAACDGCGLCLTAAPANIRLERDSMQAEIYKQPENPEEIKKLRELVRACPPGAVSEVSPD